MTIAGYQYGGVYSLQTQLMELEESLIVKIATLQCHTVTFIETEQHVQVESLILMKLVLLTWTVVHFTIIQEYTEV